jgi:predicted ATP-dependent serine protease
VVIPDVFNQRMKTGIARVDRAFGGGLIPGGIFTVTGSPGAGKTTFLLQMFEALAKQGYKTAYASGEECVEMLANTCKRINVKVVEVANETNIDKLLELTEKYDVIGIDSFASVDSDIKSSRAHEKYCVQELCKLSKQNECVIGLVLHITKGGMYKGGTIIPHSVDTVVHLNRDMIEGQPDNYVTMHVTKNRFGPTGEEQLLLTSTGYDWNFTPPPINNSIAAPKSNRRTEEMEELLRFNCLNVERAQTIIKSTKQRASYILRELTLEGKFQKTGRGTEAIYNKK